MIDTIEELLNLYPEMTQLRMDRRAVCISAGSQAEARVGNALIPKKNNQRKRVSSLIPGMKVFTTENVRDSSLRT
jgi:hypothetical protein